MRSSLGVLASAAALICTGAALSASQPHRIVFAANRVNALNGGIYRVALSGRSQRLNGRQVAAAMSLSADGRWVAFTTQGSTDPGIDVVRTDGSNLHRIWTLRTTTANLGAVQWSPDNVHLVVVVGGPTGPTGIWIGDANGRGRLLPSAIIDAGSWSPDGTTYLYSRGADNTKPPDQMVALSASGFTRWLIHAPQQGGPNWSPDGKRVVWSSGRGTVVYDASGRKLNSIAGNPYASWSPDGTLLATSGRNGLELWKHGLGRPRVVSMHIPQLQGCPCSLRWADNHRLILDTTGTPEWIGFRVPNGTRWTVSENDLRVRSRDGRTRVWESGCCASHVQNLFVSNASGKRTRVLVHRRRCSEDNYYGDVTFTPDSQSLVYISTCYDPEADLFTANPDGTHVRRLTRTFPWHEADPVWSPDGRQIAYERWQGHGNCHGCLSEIWVMNVDGTNSHALTNENTNPDGTGYFDVRPSWSPDGKSIAFARSTGNMFDHIWIVAASGGSPHSIHRQGGSPVWTTHGIAYIDPNRSFLGIVQPDGRGNQVISRAAVRYVWKTGPSSFAWATETIHDTTATTTLSATLTIHQEHTVRQVNAPFNPVFVARGNTSTALLLGPVANPQADLWQTALAGQGPRRLVSGVGEIFGADER